MRPDIASAYGAAQQWSQDFPVLQRQQQGIVEANLQSAAMQSRAGQQAQALAAHTQMANAQRQAQAQAQGEQQAHQSQMLAQQQSGQYGLQAQHAELQMMVANNQLSQQENLRLQRLRSAMGTVQEQVQNGSLTQEEGNDLLMQIRTGISPLEQRKARAAQEHIRLQNMQLEKQMAFQDKLMAERERFRNSNFEDRVIKRYDDAGNAMEFITNPDGTIDWHSTQFLHEMRRAGRGGSTGAGGQGGRVGEEGGGTGRNANIVNGLTPQNRIAIRNRMESEMERERTEVRNAEGGLSSGASWMRSTTEWNNELARRVAAEETRLAPPPPPSGPRFDQRESFQRHLAQVQQHFPNLPLLQQQTIASNAMQQERQQFGQGGFATMLQAARRAASGLGEQTPQQNPNNQFGEAQPFQPDNPDSQTPGQRTAMERFQSMRQIVDSNPAYAAQRQQLNGYIQEAVQLLSEFGSVGQMPPWAQANYAALRRRLETIRAPQTNRRSVDGGWALTHEILGAPERLYRLFNGPTQRPFGERPYQGE